MFLIFSALSGSLFLCPPFHFCITLLQVQETPYSTSVFLTRSGAFLFGSFGSSSNWGVSLRVEFFARGTVHLDFFEPSKSFEIRSCRYFVSWGTPPYFGGLGDFLLPSHVSPRLALKALSCTPFRRRCRYCRPSGKAASRWKTRDDV